MPAQSAEGIILRKYLLRETSYILVVFTENFGKIRGVMKGVRNPYPQFAGNFEIFTRCDLLFYRKHKRPMDLITHCEAVDFYLPVRKDIERLTYANYFIELINVVTSDYDPNEELYRVLVRSLEMLGTGSSAKRVSRIFEIKTLGAIGLRPELDICCGCGGELGTGSVFSISSGGTVCSGCASRSGSYLRLSPGTLKFLRKIQSSEIDRLAHIKVSSQVGRETERILKSFMAYHLGRQMRSLKFLETLQKERII
ncbi:MAG: DNA repair protein RecO [Candidatus Omnitrophica bacterium]|nr:DNA repair protein RecO [Candidatus Omnitrophota bacterium]